MKPTKKKPRNFISGLAQVICTIITIVVLISFLYYLFDVASFSASVKNTVEVSCKTLISLFENDSPEAEKLTAEELRAATNYIIEAGEYFSVASNSNMISIIYAFATTVILTAGAFVLGKITKKSEEANTNLTELNNKASESEKHIANIESVYSSLLDLQNITSYMLYANILINDCENNLANGTDNFKLFNELVNKLKMIPDEYRKITSDEMEDKFGGDLGCKDFGKTLFLTFVDFRNNYKRLIKQYVDYHCANDSQFKKNYIETSYDCINDIIDDIIEKQNNKFYEIY